MTHLPDSPHSFSHNAAVATMADIARRARLRRVHVLAWRDLDDPEAGGSEVHAATVAALWAEAGIGVTMRTSFAAGYPPTAERDGYRVVRRAGRYLVFPRAALAELTRLHGRRDALVEIWNGMPFLSPLWSRCPRVIVLHHVHADMWRMVLPSGLARLGNAMERRLAPPLYRREQVITLSGSSRDEIVSDLGFAPERVKVVPPGIDARFTPEDRTSPPPPQVLAVGRLVPVKRFDLLVRAADRARRQVPNLTLTIVGQGYEHARLADLVRRLDAEKWVTFTHSIEAEELVHRYREARIVASASAREGWGMTLTEAAACATPAVATRIAGHVDAVLHNRTGLLVDDEAELASALVRLCTDDELWRRLAAGAAEHARGFTWDATALGILEALAAQAEHHRGRYRSGHR